MKIRIYDDSIRLRLDRSEVEGIAAREVVAGHTHFPDGSQFTYRLVVHRTGACANSEHVVPAETVATYADGCIQLSIDQQTAEFWANTETEVSIRSEHTTSNGPLKLLIEKDFECLDPREGEDQSNRFVNPKAQSNHD
ncbi:MAG: hypothetical protein AAF541_03075 [Pseudomonadota bacterium]